MFMLCCYGPFMRSHFVCLLCYHQLDRIGIVVDRSCPAGCSFFVLLLVSLSDAVWQWPRDPMGPHQSALIFFPLAVDWFISFHIWWRTSATESSVGDPMADSWISRSGSDRSHPSIGLHRPSGFGWIPSKRRFESNLSNQQLLMDGVALYANELASFSHAFILWEFLKCGWVRFSGGGGCHRAAIFWLHHSSFNFLNLFQSKSTTGIDSCFFILFLVFYFIGFNKKRCLLFFLSCSVQFFVFAWIRMCPHCPLSSQSTY